MELEQAVAERRLFIFPGQVSLPHSLTGGTLTDQAQEELAFYGFNIYRLERFLTAGEQREMVTTAEFDFERAQMDTALTASGYQAEILSTGETLYQLPDGDHDFGAPLVLSRSRLLDRIVVGDKQFIMGATTELVTDSVAAAHGERPSLATNPAFAASVTALRDPAVAEMGDLLGVIWLDPAYVSDPEWYVGAGNTTLQLNQYRENPLPAYDLAAFATYHTDNASYLVLALVLPSGTDVTDTADILAERLQNYTSLATGQPFDEQWAFEKALGVETAGPSNANVALVVMRVDDPVFADQGLLTILSWVDLLNQRDVFFLVR
jgi:hypothetical protein